MKNMAEIKLVRVDFRLIHGQIITKWRKIFKISKIIVIDDILAADDFMINVYSSAAPADVVVKVYSVDKATRLWEKNQFGTGDALVLFKDIATCSQLAQSGVRFPAVQLGGVPQTPERKGIAKAVFLSEKEMQMLQTMHDKGGVDFTVQIMPDDAPIGYDEIVKIYKSK